ncbi:hypothetical protein GCM10022254_50030 [Actinomadura meridiana]|uniref:Ketosynthase family 3 (KS3) domain-containing protein n=1 Tax=Actinomadura meridiana TaxID=559626 RepID=A0ABP8CD26_9ACTN
MAADADIAIIGMACLFPGASDVDGYWAAIVGGADSIGGGGFLPDVPFDAAAYGIDPGGVEPIRLLALEVAGRALRDAGYADRPFDRSRTSVIFGAGGPCAGGITSVIADRLDLGGVGYSVDADGVASLAALDAACKELLVGSSDLVLCGGAELRDGGEDHLPPSGHCAMFDGIADDVVSGEGVACVALKRLADAERDGDRIYAVVAAVAGAGGEARCRAVGRAYERAGVAPASVGLVEAHEGGDQAALGSAFADAAPGSVAFGSVAAQIGDTGCAAGLAGLIKTAYALYAGVLPGAPRDFGWTPGGPFAFGGSARPWAVPAGERYAGLNGAGDGGVGFHAVLSGYGGAPEPVSGLAEWPAELFLIRAADQSAARAELGRLAVLLDGAPRLRDLARTAAALGGPLQVAFVATGPDDLRLKLDLAGRFRPAPGVFVPQPSGEPGQVAFLFPGQGCERPAMHADLFVAFPRLQRLLRLAGGRYAKAMFPPAASTPDEACRQRAELADPRVAQPALGIAGLAVHRLLTALGVHPDLAGGHGHGELTALCAAGVLDDGDMVDLGAARADAVLAAAGADPGGMAAVAASLRDVRAVLDGLSEIVVAGHDAPRRVMISGTSAGLDRALGALSAAGLPAERVPAACALHSPVVAAAAAELRADLLRRDLRSPAFPVWSNTTAAPYGTDPAALAAAFAGQVSAPVRFAEQIETMYGAGARVFVETGPGDVLTGLVGQILGERPHTAVSCDVPGENGVVRLLRALGELAAAGVPVDPPSLFAGRGARVRSGDSRAPGWVINERRPVERAQDDGPRVTTAAVLDYLRAGREVLAAQRAVILRHLGAVRPPVPAPRPVQRGETVRAPRPAATTDRQVWPRAERCEVVRQVPRVVELDALPPPPESGTVFAGRHFHIVDDECGIAPELARMLGRLGAQVRTLPETDGACDGLIQLAALRPAAAPVLPGMYEGVRRALAGGLRWLAVASGAGGTFGRRFEGGGAGDPAPGAGLPGLARTVALEHPEVLVRAVDVDTEATPRAIAQRILAEVLNADGPIVVGHGNGQRYGMSLVPAELDGEPEPPVGPDGVVLLTGGACDVTARIARELARTTRCHVEVMGREGETERTLAMVREHAASVRYHAADVRDPRAVRGVVDGVYARHGRLDGVVHGAGFAQDRDAGDATPESFERVYRTQVDGASALVQAVRPDLGFFAVLAGAPGDRGRADRAAADDACGTLANVWRTRLRGRVVVTAWGPWADAGTPPPEATALLREIAHGDETQVVFAGGDR